ncbi:MAG: outer membrane beta-barrel protein [Ignavibacteria bacterium]
MNTFKASIFTLVLALVLTFTSNAQISNKPVTKSTVKKQSYPEFTIAPSGGAIFPLSRAFRNDFKPGGMAGLDMGLKLNKEVAIYGKFSYMFMASKKTGAPIGQYMEFSAGPRYYFTHPKLKSQVYFEGGAGAYYFKQNSYVNPEDQTSTIDQVSKTNAGINGGIGASLYLTDALSILAKTKYHNVFTQTGSVGFMTINAGLEFKIR